MLNHPADKKRFRGNVARAMVWGVLCGVLRTVPWGLRAVPWGVRAGVVGGVLGVVACAGLGGCSLVAPKFEKPQVSVASVELVGGNFLQQNFRVKLNIQNPNDRALPVASVHVELNVGGERIASGVSTRAFVVPAHGETQFDMDMTANMALALLKLAGRKDQHADSIDYDMTGGANIDLPFLHDLPFHQNGSFSLRSPQ